jgi:hypothetical protein
LLKARTRTAVSRRVHTMCRRVAGGTASAKLRGSEGRGLRGFDSA